MELQILLKVPVIKHMSDKLGILGGKRKPTKISFTVPDLKQNIVATRMHIEIMGIYQDACIGLDWNNVKK